MDTELLADGNGYGDCNGKAWISINLIPGRQAVMAFLNHAG